MLLRTKIANQGIVGFRDFSSTVTGDVFAHGVRVKLAARLAATLGKAFSSSKNVIRNGDSRLHTFSITS